MLYGLVECFVDVSLVMGLMNNLYSRIVFFRCLLAIERNAEEMICAYVKVASNGDEKWGFLTIVISFAI